MIRDVSDVEIADAHFSNNEIFESNTSPITFKLPQVKSNEKYEHSVFVTPKITGDHKLEAATYSYKLNGESFKGISTNKPS